MRIAYLVNQYPAVSHTFIRREIEALERAGVEIARFAIRPAKSEIVAEEDRREAARTHYILDGDLARLAADVTASAGGAPLSRFSALPRALAMGARSEAGLGRHVVYWGEAAALARALKRENLRHVHAHFGTNSATVAMLAAAMVDGAFSMTVHGPEEFDKPGLIALPEKIEAARFVAAVSNYGAGQLRRLVAPELWERIRVVRCGVDKAFYEGASAPLPSAPRFASVGRLCAQKGQITLIEAAAILKREGREFEIAIVGDGEMRPGLEEAARRFDVAERIAFMGWMAPKEVRLAIERARSFVLPSYAEGLPVSIMEAFALGRPVISTYVGGIPELVEPGANGWLVPATDAAALARAMAEVLDSDSARLAAMGASGKARVAACHDSDKLAAQLKALFEDGAAAERAA